VKDLSDSQHSGIPVTSKKLSKDYRKNY